MVKARKVAAKGGRVAGSGVGGFLTGIFSSPAGLGAIGLFSLLAVVFIFRKQISEAVSGFGSGIGSGDLNIGFPEIKFPEISFPDISFPEIKFPDITFPSFDFDFGAGLGDIGAQITKAFDDFSKQFVPEDRIDVPFGDTGETIDVVPDVTGGIADRLRDQQQAAAIAAIPDRDIQDDIEGLTPAQSFAFIERGVIPTGFEVVGGVLQKIMEMISPSQPSDLVSVSQPEIPFAVANVFETQQEFQERSQAFAEAFPEIAFSTSLTPEITFGRQLSRESEDFQSVLEAEAQRSESIFAALFGNVQNPNF